MMTSLTREVTILPKAAPMMMPTARSRTLPRSMNAFRSFHMVRLLSLQAMGAMIADGRPRHKETGPGLLHGSGDGAQGPAGFPQDAVDFPGAPLLRLPRAAARPVEDACLRLYTIFCAHRPRRMTTGDTPSGLPR